MTETTDTIPELDEDKSPLLLWTESVGKAFKLVTKSYGLRTVTYTKINALKETETSGEFDVEVSCAEITARVLNSKRSHSSGCKEGVIHLNEESILRPCSFGDDCRTEEFEQISAEILAHTTANLDLVVQRDAEEEAVIEVPIDLPHLKLSEMEASLLRNSPFLIKRVYLLSINSRRAAFESINLELKQAARNSRLTDTCDPVYVAQKNDAIVSLRNKLNAAVENTGLTTSPLPSQTRPPLTLVQKKPAAVPVPVVAAPAPAPTPVICEVIPREPEPEEPKAVASSNRRLGLTTIEKKNSIALALRGKSSAANLFWEIQNPSKEGPVFRIGKVCGLLEFSQWAHISGRTVSAQETAGKKLRSYFSGADLNYMGPDKDGIFPLLKLESEAAVRTATAA